MARVRISAALPRAAESAINGRVSFPPVDRGATSQAPLIRQPPAGPQILNAYISDRHHISLVYPAPGTPTGRRIQRIVAEFSCLVSAHDITGNEGLERYLRNHADVRWVKRQEDGWYRIGWVDRDACRHYCRKLHDKGIQTYEGVINPVLRWMCDNNAAPAKPRRLWVDLETDSRVSFAQKESARTLCWTTIDEDGNEEGALLRSDTDKREREMYGDLWDVMRGYDQVIAWNGDGFDFPVIKARSLLHGIIRNDDQWKERLWLDQLEAFKRFNMAAAESGDEKQSMKLGDVAQVLLGYGKDDFDASKTWEAWEAGGSERQRMFKYCAQDTRLMPAIEDETGFIEILQALSETCGTLPDTRGMNPSVFVEGYMQRLALAEGKPIPTVTKIVKGDPYKGAFVMDPRCHGITKGVHVADFSSLYPTIIRTWNMSPETITVLDPPPLPGERPDMVGKLYSWSPLTGQVFTTAEEGLLPKAVRSMMDLRKQWTKKKNAEPPGTPAWKDADRRSSAYKIAANSCYGVVGQPTNRLFNRDVAESVAQCGAWLILETIKAAEAQGMSVIYADTDSLFVHGADRDVFEKFVAWCNVHLYPRILEIEGCNENFIDLAYEKEFERVIFTTAKRYAGMYAHYKGADATEDSKPEIKGLEYKRGDSIRLTRRMQEQVVYMLVGYKCEAVEDPGPFVDLMNEWSERVLNQPLALEEVVISKKMGKPLDGYARKVKKDGTFARQLPHVEMARILEGRGRDVSEGTKIDYVILDGSTKPVTVIPAEDWGGVTDRFAIWDTQVYPPTMRVLEAAFPDHDWTPWKRTRPKAVRKPRAAKAATPTN